MAKQTIDLGSVANDGTGTTLRAGGDMINDNFTELYNSLIAAAIVLDDTDLLVVPVTELQAFAEGVDHSLFKARGTGVNTSYISTVAVGGTTFAQPEVFGEIKSDQGYFDIHYTGATSITIADLSATSTYVYIDNAGNLQQQTTIPTRQDWSRKIFTMRIGVDTVSQTILGFEYLNNPIGNFTNTSRDLYSFLLAQGVPFKKDQLITGRAGDLGFDVSAGSLLEFGGTGDIDNPNILSFNSVSNASYTLLTRTTIASVETNLVKFWDNAGTITALGSTTLVGHRLFRYSDGAFAMQYGQGNYANMALAKAGVPTENYVLNPILKDATFFGWWFIESTATNTGGTTLTDFVEYTLGVQGGSSSSLSGALLKGNNLSDLLDTAAARTNLEVKFEDRTDPLDSVYMDGNVGINTLTPSEKLEVDGSIKATSFIKDGATANDILLGDGSSILKGDLIINRENLGDELKKRIVLSTSNIDWSLGIEFTKTLAAAWTITESNLPTGTDTGCIVIYVTGEYAITPPAYWKKHGTGAYDGTKINLFVIDCLNGTSASEDVKYIIIPAV